MEELKECPFCGNAPIVLSDEDYKTMCEETYGEIPEGDDCDGMYIICPATDGGCGACSGWGETLEDATKLWNRRKH